MKHEAEELERSVAIATMGHALAGSEAARINNDSDIPYLGLVAMPYEWGLALKAAREVVIEAARRGVTLTFGELQVAAFRGSGHKIGYSMYGTCCMELTDPVRDGCLISSIIVNTDTGEPGPGLLPFARSVGFDKSVSALQQDVYERFGDHRRGVACKVAGFGAP